MSKNIEQLVKKILQAENFSSPPIDAKHYSEAIGCVENNLHK